MRVLDLFSGTQSVGKALQPHDEYVSLDITGSLGEPMIKTDILDWDYKNSGYPPGYFDVIWAGCPCTEFSKLRLCCKATCGPPDLVGAGKIVQRTLRIIRYFKPKHWIIENPDSGSLKDQDYMKKLPYIRVSYCMFGFPYRKTTRLWGTIKGFGDRVCNRKCGMIVDGKHQANIGNASWIRRDQRNSYPQPLVRALMEFCRPIRRSGRFVCPVAVET